MSSYSSVDDNQYDDSNTKMNNPKPCYSSLYLITHLVLSFFAIYLSWKCNGGKFSPLHFIIALCCPHLYIIWSLAVHGGCGVFDQRTGI